MMHPFEVSSPAAAAGRHHLRHTCVNYPHKSLAAQQYHAYHVVIRSAAAYASVSAPVEHMCLFSWKKPVKKAKTNEK